MQPQVRSGAARGWTWADCTYLKSCSKKNCSLVSITFPPPIKMILITPINASAWEKHAHFHQWLTLQEIRPYQLCNNETCSSATQLTFLTKLSGGKMWCKWFCITFLFYDAIRIILILLLHLCSIYWTNKCCIRGLPILFWNHWNTMSSVPRPPTYHWHTFRHIFGSLTEAFPLICPKSYLMFTSAVHLASIFKVEVCIGL